MSNKTVTNREKILDHLRAIAPRGATNGQIGEATGVRPHQQIYQITQQLVQEGQIQARRQGHAWRFFASGAAPEPVSEQPPAPSSQSEGPSGKMTAYAFEALTRRVMSDCFNLPLGPGQVGDVPKRFDLVSSDGQVVGDAKYYTLVRGKYLPPAKFATIAEHVWLLEMTQAPQLFLVFGNEIRVPRMWLERFGHLVDGVGFFFLSDSGELTKLN